MANTREVDVHELKALDPRRFEKEHMDFVSHIDYEWWDVVGEDFKRQMYELDVTVAEIAFEGIDYGHADASWSGQIGLAHLMKRMGLDERYPALYLAVEHDQSWARVYLSGWRNKTMEVELIENTRFMAPLGIFSELDEETWEELLDDQWSACGLEEVARGFAQDKANELLDALQSEWDHISSEEYFVEMCENNEVKFEIEEGETV